MPPTYTNESMSGIIRLDLVVPVFNEEETLPFLFERLQALITSIDKVEIKVYFVDDHSTDNTAELLKGYCVEHEAFRYLRLAVNSGSHVAILAGLSVTHGDCAVFLSSDLQDPPELISNLIKQWRKGFKVVWAVREEREGMSFFEKCLAKTFWSLLSRMTSVEFPPSGTDFALMDRKIINALKHIKGPNINIVGEVAHLGLQQTRVYYVKKKRKHGRSKWTIGKKLKAFADAFVAFSFVPMRLMSYVGLTVSIIGFIYAFFIIGMRIFINSPVEGWSSLMVVILTLCGIQMVMLGVLGEYLWRTLDEARQRPLFIIEDSYGFKEEGGKTTGD